MGHHADGTLQLGHPTLLLVDAAGGSLLVLAARGSAETDAVRLEQLCAEAREQEWAEFADDCAKL